MTNASARAHRLRIATLLFLLCLSLYLLTYRALIQSGDTRRALDAVTSVARYGDWLMDETNALKLPFRIRDSSALPLGEYRVEEGLNILLASPLLKLAEALPRLGNIHTVWLFNVIITALIASLVYLILREMGYADAVAALVAVGAGFGTNLWAYSQTFFREPLTAFFILLALFALQRGARGGIGARLISLVCAATGLVLAYETKHSALFAVPALLVFALPEARLEGYRAWRPAISALIALPLLCLCLLALLDPLPSAIGDLLSRFGLRTDHLSPALRAYLLSPGASLWATSPLALFAIPGALMLWRRGRRRLVAACFLLVAGYALGHALLTGAHWFGGLSYPPRFLLPAQPALMLLTAPIAQAVLRENSKRIRFLWLALLAYGLWIQVVGVSLSLSRYSESLPPESNGYAEWVPSLTQPRYFRWIVLPRRWGDLGVEFLWTRANLPIWGASFALAFALAAFALWHCLRRPGSRWRHLAPLLALSFIPLVLLNLMNAYDKDPQTQSSQGALHEALDFLARNARADDLLLLSSTDYEDFILNHLDGAIPRPIALERPPAQAASDRQPALVVSESPNDWFDVQSFRVLRHLAGRQERLWLLENTSAFMLWSFRPLERYLAGHFYPLREIELGIVDETVRLLEYSTGEAAPNPLSQYAGEIATDLRFGEGIRLLSLVAPDGESYAPGDVVHISLLWVAEAPVEHDYTVAAFIADARQNRPIAQGMDSAPQAGFAPTSSWKPGAPVWDNRALRLPEDAVAGDYQLWLLMYRQGSAGVTRLPVAGRAVIQDGTVGVPPITIAVR